MNSLANKIKLAIISCLSIISVFAAIVFGVNQVSVYQNQQIIETMTMEYNIIALTDSVIQNYNIVVKNPDNASFKSIYNDSRNNSLKTLSDLKSRIISSDSKVLLFGVSNTVNKVIELCDKGIAEIRSNNFTNISSYFDEANKNDVFVKDNTSALLQKELEYLSTVQENSKKTSTMLATVSIGLFLVVLIAMIIISSLLAKQIVLPIYQLTESAKTITSDNFNITIDNHLINQKSEVGILANSFTVMVDNIKQKISELKSTNDTLSQSQNELKSSIAQLAKVNSFMVNRELKMVELKKKISELESKTKP